MNLGWATPLESNCGDLATKFEELTESYSNGTIYVKLRCCAQIATEDDTFKALQLGAIDGSDNGTSVIQEMKLFEFAEHLVILDHFAGFSPVLTSDRFMSELSDEQRDAVMRAAAEAGAYHTAIKISEIESIREWLSTEGGMTMTRPDRVLFIEAAQQVQQAVAADRGEDFADLVNAIQAAAE